MPSRAKVLAMIVNAKRKVKRSVLIITMIIEFMPKNKTFDRERKKKYHVRLQNGPYSSGKRRKSKQQHPT
jgi:hypothetical protein